LDVKRWDVGAIHSVFATASVRAATLQHLGDNLAQVHNVLADWQGKPGTRFAPHLPQILGRPDLGRFLTLPGYAGR
jgi:hypothetical protein